MAGLGLLDDPLPLNLGNPPRDYSQRVWSTAFRAADLADVGYDDEDRGRRCEAQRATVPGRRRVILYEYITYGPPLGREPA